MSPFIKFDFLEISYQDTEYKLVVGFQNMDDAEIYRLIGYLEATVDAIDDDFSEWKAANERRLAKTISAIEHLRYVTGRYGLCLGDPMADEMNGMEVDLEDYI